MGVTNVEEMRGGPWAREPVRAGVGATGSCVRSTCTIYNGERFAYLAHQNVTVEPAKDLAGAGADCHSVRTLSRCGHPATSHPSAAGYRVFRQQGSGT